MNWAKQSYPWSQRCITYLPVAGIKDRVCLDLRVLGKVHNSKGKWQLAVRLRSWEPTSSTTSMKQRENWKWGQAMNSQGPPLVTYFLWGGCVTFPNTATNWGSDVQISEPKADTSHSRHKRRHLGGERGPELPQCAWNNNKIYWRNDGRQNETHVNAPQFNYGLGWTNLKLH